MMLTIKVMELGAEVFMGLVKNLSEGSKDANTVHVAVSSERAWIMQIGAALANFFIIDAQRFVSSI